MAEAQKKPSKIRQIILGGVFLAVLIIIVYLVYTNFINKGVTPPEISSQLLIQEEIVEVPFDSEVLKEPPFSELQSYGKTLEVDEIKIGRNNPFVPY